MWAFTKLAKRQFGRIHKEKESCLHLCLILQQLRIM